MKYLKPTHLLNIPVYCFWQVRAHVWQKKSLETDTLYKSFNTFLLYKDDLCDLRGYPYPDRQSDTPVSGEAKYLSRRATMPASITLVHWQQYFKEGSMMLLITVQKRVAYPDDSGILQDSLNYSLYNICDNLH